MDSAPLYDQLVAGGFNGLSWDEFVDMCERIVAEENTSWCDMVQPIRAYAIEDDACRMKKACNAFLSIGRHLASTTKLMRLFSNVLLYI